MDKKLSLMAIAAIAVVGAAVFAGANTVSAQSTGESLVDKISNKFNLSSEEVQGVFDEFREEKHAARQAEVSENLQAKVDDGTITAEQKTLIENKLIEVREQKMALKDQDLTKEEWRERAQQTHEELEQWVEDNNIPEDVMPFRGGEHRGPGHKGGFGFRGM